MDNTKKIKRNIKPFNGEQYSIWKFRLRALIEEENALQVIDENPPEEITDEWRKRERTAKGCIIEHLSDTMIGIVTENNTAKEIIEKLDAIYERKSLATQLDVQKRLLSFKLQPDVPLISHFIKFDEMMIELTAAGAGIKEMGKVAHLLLTLPSSYDSVVTAIQTLAEDDLSLAFVKTRLLDHEIKIRHQTTDTSAKVLHTETDNSKSHNQHQNRRNWQNFRGRRQNTYSRSNNQQRKFVNKFKKNKHWSNNQMKCEHCGRTNHTKRDCYYYKQQQLNQDRDRDNRNHRTLQAVQTIDDFEEPRSFAFMVGAEDKNLLLFNCENEITFILDSGATDHLVNRLDLFSSYKELEQPINISVAKNDTKIEATVQGTIQVTSNMGVKGILENVLYSKDVPYNLLSVRRMQDAGLTVIFKANGGVLIKKDGRDVIKGEPLKDLISIRFNLDKIVNQNVNKQANVVNNSENNYEIWHKRLGHIGKEKFLQIKTKELAYDSSCLRTIIPSNDLCEPCINGKQARKPFAKAKDKSHIQRPLFNIHTDVCGPITPPTIDNKRYFITFIDEYTHYTVTYLAEYKSEVFTVFKDYVAKGEAHFNLRIVNLYCDNGREYLSNEQKEFCIQRGITYHLTVTYTPQQNGVAERMNRSLTEKARAMINGADLDKRFWGEAVLTATYLINLTPTKAIMLDKTPFELWHNKKPRLSNLKVFGSTAYVHNKIRQGKFDENSFKGIMMGYESNGYKIFDAETCKFIKARDVIFDEINFKTSRPVLKLDEEVSFENHHQIEMPQLIKSVHPIRDPSETDNNKSVIKTDIEHGPSSSKVVKINDNPNETTEVRRSERIKKRSSVTYKEYDNEITENSFMCAQSLICKLPSKYEEIETRDDKVKWVQAIEEEINSLLQNQTWTLVHKPADKNIVDCKWVFTIKNDIYGNPSKYKARLVARGFSQQYLLDYNETFAPVTRISTFRFLLAFANQFNLLIHQMDVKTAFLNGILKEEIYMRVPDGIKVENDNIVCKLNKSLYGLKQSARCWFERFDQILKQHNFKNSSVDHCLYFLNKGHINENIYVVLYVDDILIVTGNITTMSNFKDYLKKYFCMVNLNEIKLFLGIMVERNENEISLSQKTYLETVLKKFNMGDCKAVSTPLPTKLNYDALNSDENCEAPCRNLIGCLMYAMLCTRPDLCTATNILSRYQSKNNKDLWQCLKRVLRYIKGTINLKLVYKRGEFKEILVGFVDSDWGSNETDRKSTTGYLFKLFERCLICWNTKRQNSVAVSSTEAEYMALFEGVREALWLKSLLNSINFQITQSITIFEDNTGCISIANNPTSHKRSKHIDIKYHFTREQIENKTIILKYISTGKQLADIFTKQIPGPRFQEIRSEIGLTD